MSQSCSDNRRTEYAWCREEISRSDRACIRLMGLLVATTTALFSVVYRNEEMAPLACLALGPAWLIGYWYFTEKRFVIIRIAEFLRSQVEPKEDGLEYETYLNRLSRQGKMRPALPLDPYHLECLISTAVIAASPILGFLHVGWKLMDFFFLTSVLCAIIHTCIAVRTQRIYGIKPQEFSSSS